jgi:hypothetical protein
MLFEDGDRSTDKKKEKSKIVSFRLTRASEKKATKKIEIFLFNYKTHSEMHCTLKIRLTNQIIRNEKMYNYFVSSLGVKEVCLCVLRY